MQSTEIPPGLVIQGFTPPLNLRDFKLIAFDMDSTLINIECVDEIADAVGRKADVAAITEATMRGEIADFKESLRQRVALLKGVSLASMEEVYTQRLQLNPGAAELVAASGAGTVPANLKNRPEQSRRAVLCCAVNTKIFRNGFGDVANRLVSAGAPTRPSSPPDRKYKYRDPGNPALAG